MCGAQSEKKKMADQTMPELLLNDPIVTIFVKTEILEEKFFENKMHASCLSNFTAFAKPTTCQGLKIHQRQSVK